MKHKWIQQHNNNIDDVCTIHKKMATTNVMNWKIWIYNPCWLNFALHWTNNDKLHLMDVRCVRWMCHIHATFHWNGREIFFFSLIHYSRWLAFFYSFSFSRTFVQAQPRRIAFCMTYANGRGGYAFKMWSIYTKYNSYYLITFFLWLHRPYSSYIHCKRHYEKKNIKLTEKKTNMHIQDWNVNIAVGYQMQKKHIEIEWFWWMSVYI